MLPGFKTKPEIRKALEYIKPAIIDCKYDNLNIGDVRKRHIRAILGKVGQNKKKAKEDKNEQYEWGAASYNHYRSYLMILFDQLEEVEATEVDPVTKIKKRKTIKRSRPVLSKLECNRVDAYLFYFFYTFWRFTHIFFHSGARVAEMMRVKKEDLDLANQLYRVTILKGREYAEEWKTIKTVAFPFWEEVAAEAQPGQYLFSVGLKPGGSPINEHQITRRWREHVKKDLRITADFYSLKHLNTTQTVRMKGDLAAAKQNSHKGTGMVVSIYDVERGSREHEELKEVNNPFGELG
jgi:integrase